MYHLIAQMESTTVLDRFPSDELLAMYIVSVVFGTFLVIAIAWFVTSTVQSISVAAANARMAAKLSQQGVPGEQIERLVLANHNRSLLDWLKKPALPSRWREPQRPGPHSFGKPV